MDFKDLNKSQLILLALLVSFVASIATSIATVSLLQVAPTNVTNTINRVIEKTIEQAAPATTTSSSKTVQTLIVKEDDLIVDAIARYNDAQVVISEGNDLTQPISAAVSNGFVVGTDNLVLADGRNINSSKKYIGSFGKDLHAVLEMVSNDNNIAVFKFVMPESPAPALSLPPALSLADMSKIKIGQTLVFYSTTASKVLKRIASSFTAATTADASNTNDPKQPATPGLIVLSDDIPTDFIGLPGLTLDGEVAGVAVSMPDSTVKLIDADAVKNLLKSAAAPKS